MKPSRRRISFPVAALLLLLAGGCGEDDDPRGGDFVPPAPVADLAGTAVDSTSIFLTWTAVGDDGRTGSAAIYDLRYSPDPIADSTWTAALSAQNEPHPAEAGQAESLTVSGLLPGVTYSFALRVGDEVPNWSEFSNVIDVTTSPGEEADQGWWSGFGEVGFDRPVYALTVYEDALIAGGGFTLSGGQDLNRIARWDGTDWHPLGAGLNGQAWALTVHEGDLYVGGAFDIAGETLAHFVARWDGQSWYPLGQGTDNHVLAMTVWEDDLVVGGFFTMVGGEEASYLARWDGDAWHPIPGLDGPVYSLTVYEEDLVVGGAFVRAGETDVHQIARWDGITWASLDAGVHASPPQPSVSALTVYEGSLVAGGYFSSAGETPVGNLALWNTAGWSHPDNGTNEEVLALTSYNGLVAGGRFTLAGNTEANLIARWNGNGWQAFSTGIGPASSFVWALARFRGSLYVGGFFETAGGFASSNIARWDE